MGRVQFTLLLSLLAFGAVFILFQIYILKATWMQLDDVERGKNKKKRKFDDWNPPSQYIAIQVFADVASDHHVPVFLVDPDILESVWDHRTGKRTAQGQCRFLCQRANTTTFGIISSHWITKSFLNALHQEGFRSVSLQGPDPRLASLDDPSPPAIQQHHFFVLHGHMVHLVCFYVRAGSYLWHGSISPPVEANHGDGNKGDFRILRDYKFRDLPFGGKHSGSYRLMEFADIRIDEVSLTVPKYPMQFLQQLPSPHLECNIQQAREFLSEYGMDDTAEAADFRARARDILERGARALDKLGVPFWISSGTCLGWFRECNIIAHSMDVDFGMRIRDYNNHVVPAMESQGLQLLHLFGKEGDSFELSFARDSIKLDIFFFYEEEDYIWNGGTDDKTGDKFKYIFPKFDLCWTELVGLRVRVPCPTLPYIEANYGREWNRKVTKWNWKESPPNVRPNGRWPAAEWPKVMQTFPIM
ncbi:ribitol-5-phosphate transferase FKTN-like [Diadema antillarum]|uniref:ribitol-5-phosphate transferase FKTN-like n=1 Tax=Diadema antillarum TaxID=105358 RepID=UPI003A891E28